MAQVDPSLVSTPCSHFDSDAAAALPRSRAGRLRGGWPRLCLGVALAGFAGAAPAKQTAAPTPNAGGMQQGNGAGSSLHGAQDQDPAPHRVEEHMVERRNSERQKALMADTDKLLALAQQLKADVDKSNKDMLSIDVVKRAEQIEKLAKSVKEKMRGY